jgi:type II secretory pathway pseudopilin PulG
VIARPPIARRSPASERGSTLLELAVALVPLALISLILFSVFGFTVTFARRGGAQAETAQQARLALQVMTQDLREASVAPGAIVVWSRTEGAAQDGIGFLTARPEGPGPPVLHRCQRPPKLAGSCLLPA